jgi:hypothetical protein
MNDLNIIIMPKHEAVRPNALRVPGLVKLSGKRVVLASNSPRRKEILKTFVRSLTRTYHHHAS